MRTITRASLRAHKARLLLSSLAIVLGVAFVAGTFVFTAGLKNAFISAFADDAGKADAVVAPSTQGGDVPKQVLPAVRHVDGVAAASGRITAGTALFIEGRGRISGSTLLTSVPQDRRLQWQDVVTGRLPEKRGEAVVDTSTAELAELHTGDRIRTRTGRSAGTTTLRVVGTIDTGNSVRYGGASVVEVTPKQAAAITGEKQLGRVSMVAADGVSPEELSNRVASAVSGDLAVRTGEEQRQEEVSQVSSSLTGITVGLLAFAGIAMFVAGIVIANTFAILLAQRTRELALLRSVGARRGQVFGSVLAESAVLGLAGSVIGVAVGYGLATGVGAVLASLFDSVPSMVTGPTVASVVLPIIVGVVVTVGAAVFPARSATRVAPVQALREGSIPPKRTGTVRIVLAFTALVMGVAGLAAGTLVIEAGQGAFAVAFFGGLLAFLGILLGGPVIVPPLVRLIGALPARLLGVPAKLATSNAVRNPRRAAATTSALLVGVTLISLMTVASATLRSTTMSKLEEEFPIDYRVVASDNGGIPRAVVEDLRGVDGLESVTTMSLSQHGRVDGAKNQRVVGVNPHELADVTSALDTLRKLRPGQAVLTAELADRIHAHQGETVRVEGSVGSASLRVAAVVQQGETLASVVTTKTDVAGMFHGAPVGAVLAEMADGADPDEVGAAVREASGTATVTGAVQHKAQYTQTIDIMLLIVTALLGVAVLIAFVGIANTLALSVIERTRESGMLRALGLTRGQLRAMLSGEAILMAGVGGLLGVGLGILFGWAAVDSLVPFAAVLTVPGWRIVAFIAIAVVAGLLASVFPARRAARTSVVAALAEE